MSLTSPSLDDLLFDALTLRPFQYVSPKRQPESAGQAGDKRQFLTSTAQLTEVPQAEVRALTPLEARERLEQLMAQPEVREQLMLELGQVVPNQSVFQELGPLLGASNAEEFTRAMIARTGTDQPEALEKHLQTLTQNMEDALTALQHAPKHGPQHGPTSTLNTVIPPETAQVEAATGTNISPLLLSFLALSQVAQANETPQHAPIPAPLTVPLPKVQLDFSANNLQRVLGRKSTSDS